MKVHTTIALISFTVMATLIATSMANNSTWGQHSYYDRLLFKTQVLRKASVGQFQTANITFPGPNSCSSYVLTEVNAIDNGVNYSYVDLLKGGPGCRNATLSFKSELNLGLNYTLEIYGQLTSQGLWNKR